MAEGTSEELLKALAAKECICKPAFIANVEPTTVTEPVPPFFLGEPSSILPDVHSDGSSDLSEDKETPYCEIEFPPIQPRTRTRRVEKEVEKTPPLPPRSSKSTLSTLFPVNDLLRARDEKKRQKIKGEKKKTPIPEINPTESALDAAQYCKYNDFASIINPTAPRILAPKSRPETTPPATVRGPRGVNPPGVGNLLRRKTKRFKQIIINTYGSFSPFRSRSNSVSSICSTTTEKSETESHISVTTDVSSSDRPDGYANLIHTLVKEEPEFSPPVSSEVSPEAEKMPVHETAFLPQRGSQAQWQHYAARSRDSEGYTTTDDEFDNVPLRRSGPAHNYERHVLYANRSQSLSPSPVTMIPLRNPEDLRAAEYRMAQRSYSVSPKTLAPSTYVLKTSPISPKGYGSQQSIQRQRDGSPALRQTPPQPQPRSASPLVRGSPGRLSIGPSRGHTPYYGVIYEEDCNKLPQMMKRSFSLNPENIQQAREAAQNVSLRTSIGGTMDTPQKRVSFSNLPSDNQNNQNGNGLQSPTPFTPSRSRPTSSDSVFLYSPSPRSPITFEAPDKPLPPVPEHEIYTEVYRQNKAPPSIPTMDRRMLDSPTRWQNKDSRVLFPPHVVPQQRFASPGSESGSEAGEIQRILFKQQPTTSFVSYREDEWTSDGKTRGTPNSEQPAATGGRDEDVRRGGGGSRNRRDEPRRHTLSGDQQGGGSSSAAGNLSRSMDLESMTLQRSYYHQPAPISSSMFDDDPGIMSEVETASTGFRRGGKQRSSLPVVRTPSKTLERPLGLVFLQYRNETKRALLPNEITSIDTVKALFVRSFPKQLTMEYLDAPMVKIYIHDSSKDMFYELEDLRSHLRDIRDRSVLRLFETPDINGGAGGGVPVGGTPMPGALPPHPTPAAWDQDQSYFSEPEFDSEYQHQHIHKSKGSSKGGGSPYYMAHSYPPGQPGQPVTLPRGAPPIIRAYSPATKTSQSGVTSPPTKPQRTYQDMGREAQVRSAQPPHSSPSSPPSNQQRPQSTPPRPPERWAYLARNRDPNADRLHSESGYMSSPERGRPPYSAYPTQNTYEDPYYAQYAPRSGSITPVIDEEASDSDELMMDSYSIYGSKVVGGSAAAARIQQPSPRPSFPATGNIASQSAGALVPYDATRIRVEHMERQLANLTGLVQKALTQGSTVVGPGPRDFLQIPANQRDAYRNDDYDKHSSSSSASLPDETYLRAETTTTTISTKPPKLGKDKSVSFEKSVSFSDDPPDMLSSPKQHTPQHSADTKPTKPAIKSSTLPRTSSQERDRHKPAPPPKPMSLSSHQGQYETNRHLYRADLQLTPEMYNHLRVLQKKAKDLRQEVRNLRRMSQAQAHSVRETIRDTFIKIRAMLLTGGDSWLASGDSEKLRISREEELYKQEMLRLEKDLTELEGTVEELRGNVINKKTRVNMSDVENMALVLSKSSKTVADLKVRFPNLQDGMKSLLSSEMEKVVREEKFLKEEPERLESALRRCKKLTGTLVTLKRLASVQEQRLPIVPLNNIGDPQNQRLSPDNLLQEPSLSQQSGAISPQSKSRLNWKWSSNFKEAVSSHENNLYTVKPRFNEVNGNDNRSASDACSSSSSTSISARGIMASTGTGSGEASQRQENALDSLLDELQTFSRPPSDRHGSIDASTSTPSQSSGSGTLRRLHSYPSSDSSSPIRSAPIARLQVSDDSKPPSLPERSKVPPPPPPRTSSRSPLVSPTSPPRLVPRQSSSGGGTLLRRKREPPSEQDMNNKPLSSNSSSSESINSQEGLRGSEALEQRHQELLRRQRQLQEQYARLQQLQRNVRLTTAPELKKTGSESNLLRGLNLSAAPTSGSLTHLAPTSIVPISMTNTHTMPNSSKSSKIYETDIL